MPATRSRSSTPEGSAIASVDPGLSPSASARPAPTSASPLPRSRCPAVSGGRLEDRVIARVGDHVDRLAERERVDRLDLVAGRGGLHARQPRGPSATLDAGSDAVSW